MHLQAFSARISDHRSASAAGVLSARLITPQIQSCLPPLVALHGISRNAHALAKLLLPEAERSGRKILVPHFPVADWPVFQRPCRAARPDQALLALLAQLALDDPGFAGPVDLFGHSGGAQLAHRFAMLYPHKVARLSLAAAGWYCLPDDSMAYPYGLGDQAQAPVWSRRLRAGLPAYLGLAVRVFVGSRDTGRDSSLRQNPALDRMQGATRIARAETFVRHFRAAAKTQGLSGDISLTRLPGISHDVTAAIRDAGLGGLVVAAEPAFAG